MPSAREEEGARSGPSRVGTKPQKEEEERARGRTWSEASSTRVSTALANVSRQRVIC